MKKKWVGMLAGLLLAVWFASSTAAVSAETSYENYIVFLSADIEESQLEAEGLTVIRSFENIHAAAVKATSEQIQELTDKNMITKAEPDQPVQTSAQVTPWGHETMQIPERQSTVLTGKNIKIAILDTGVDLNHPDLNITDGVCVLSQCTDSYNDDNGHGTHVAGIIGAKDNDIGIVGVAPDAELYTIKALNSRGRGTTSTFMAGLDWAISKDVDIINLSLTTDVEDLGIKAMIDKAYQKGILVIAAAGNEGTESGTSETVMYPAKFSNVIAVSAIGKNLTRIPTSSTGMEVELTAPGDYIYSTYPTALKADGYAEMTGTSMAAPFVTGLAALYKEKYPLLTHIEMRQLLQETAKDLGPTGRDRFYGFGLAQLEQDNSGIDSISYNVDQKGKVTIEMGEILKQYSQYKVQRFDKFINAAASDHTFEDYGLKGNIEYTIIPLQNGVEQRKAGIVVNVDIAKPTYRDIDNSVWYSRYMMFLNHQSILLGYDQNELRPSQLVKRSEAVAMIGRALGYDGEKRSTRFKDVASGNSASGYIEAAAQNNILRGYPDGTFRPDEPVSRAEMAILIANAYDLQNSVSMNFKDVNEKVTGYEAIDRLAAAGITEGYSDGTFRPYEKMARSTFSVFIARAEGLY